MLRAMTTDYHGRANHEDLTVGAKHAKKSVVVVIVSFARVAKRPSWFTLAGHVESSAYEAVATNGGALAS
jgi:hypothetical protein